MENLVEDFKKNADELFKNYRKQAVENVNLGQTKKKVKQRDTTLFIQLFSVYSDKICKLANSYDKDGWSENDKINLNTLSKQYILKYRKLFNFNIK